MLATSSITILLSAAAAMASTRQGETAMWIDNSTLTLGKRTEEFVNQEFTFYSAGIGPDACTGKNHLDSDFDVAMGFEQFETGVCCGKQLTITVNGKTATASCVDECAICQYGQLDFTKGLFEYFTGGDLDVGVIHGDWSYVL
ncbi:hypothetical protein B0H19DRAFT_1274324 [Mycena capillaripes]|nr:hypothetical protein B0H19DRAFT_1274324 [Mycena capillaripes]